MIKTIFDEIANESSTNQKMVLLKKYTENDLLKRVLYLMKSPRVKFYIKQIPEYVTSDVDASNLEDAINDLTFFSERKITGHSAIGKLQSILSSLNENDAYIIERIIDKNPKIGMGSSNINKVFKDLIEKTPYQGAKAFTEALARKLFNGSAVRSDIKMDGRYANAIIRGGEVELVSRQGEVTHVGDALFLKELTKLPDGVLNGELTIENVHRYEANGIIASIVDIEKKREERGGEATAKKILAFNKKHGDYYENISKIRYTVWDRVTIDEYFDKKSERPYYERIIELDKLLFVSDCTMISLVESKLIYTYEEAVKHFQEALSNGEEGTIIKANDGHWKNGKPNWQIKMKLEIALDLKIVGFNYGTKGTKNENVISSIDLESSDGFLTTTSSGMKEDMMQHITENQDELFGTIVEIKCSGISTSKGKFSTLHPRFLALRDDKSDANTLKECIEINDASLNLS